MLELTPQTKRTLLRVLTNHPNEWESIVDTSAPAAVKQDILDEIYMELNPYLQFMANMEFDEDVDGIRFLVGRQINHAMVRRMLFHGDARHPQAAGMIERALSITEGPFEVGFTAGPIPGNEDYHENKDDELIAVTTHPLHAAIFPEWSGDSPLVTNWDDRRYIYAFDPEAMAFREMVSDETPLDTYQLGMGESDEYRLSHVPANMTRSAIETVNNRIVAFHTNLKALLENPYRN